jgi:hypothetical protein
MKGQAALTSVLSHQERKKILVPDLSGFASLREIAAEEFFTLGCGEIVRRAVEVNRPYLGRLTT